MFTGNAAKQDGKLTILGVEVEAYVSGSGRFLMFYTDSASEDRENSHAARKEETISLFSSFKA